MGETNEFETRSQEETEMFNYYIILSLDPYENIKSPKDLETRIVEHSKKWHNNSLDAFCARCLELLENIKEVMLNDVLREEERKKAISIRRKEIDDVFKIVSEKGFYTDIDLIKIAQRFQVNVNGKLILDLKERAKGIKYTEIQNTIPSSFEHFDKIHDNLRIYKGGRIKNAYEFLVSFNKSINKDNAVDDLELNVKSPLVHLQKRGLSIQNKNDNSKKGAIIYSISMIINTYLLCIDKKTSPQIAIQAQKEYTLYLNSLEMKDTIEKYSFVKHIAYTTVERLVIKAAKTTNASTEFFRNIAQYLCAMKDIAIDYPKNIELVNCFKCECLIEYSPNVKSCPYCGESLTWECPHCKQNNTSNLENCKRCGTTIKTYNRFSQTINECEKRLVNLELEHAYALVNEALSIYNDDRHASNLKKEILEKLNNSYAIVNKINIECANLNFYLAKELLTELRRIDKMVFPNLNVTIYDKLISVENLVKKMIQTPDGDEKVHLAKRIQALCADEKKSYEYLRQILLDTINCINVRVVDDYPIIEWDYKPKENYTIHTFCVVRKRGSMPNNAFDGEKIAELAFDSNQISKYKYCDKHAQSGVPYYYGVYVKLNTVISKIVSFEEPVYFLTGIISAHRDLLSEEMRIHVKAPQNYVSIIVFKSEGKVTNCLEREFFMKIDYQGRNIVINDIRTEIGKNYGYSFVVCYLVNGESAFSRPSHYLFSRTHKPKLPKEFFFEKDKDSSFKVVGSDLDEFDLVLYYSHNPINGISGVKEHFEIPDDLVEVDMNNYTFTLPENTVLYLYLGSIIESVIMLSNPIYISTIQNFKIKKLVFNGDLNIYGEWIRNCSKVIIETLYENNDQINDRYDFFMRDYRSNLQRLVIKDFNPKNKFLKIYSESLINDVFVKTPAEIIPIDITKHTIYYQYTKSFDKIEFKFIRSSKDVKNINFDIVYSTSEIPFSRQFGSVLIKKVDLEFVNDEAIYSFVPSVATSAYYRIFESNNDNKIIFASLSFNKI